MHTVPARHQRGFSLLEAIVALTIMATCLLALYAWLSTSTMALNRVRANTLSLADARTAMAVIDTINPMAEPSGRRQLPPLEIRWKSRPLSNLQLGISPAGGATQFDFRLYLLDVEVLRDDQLSREFSVRKTGWVVARPVNFDEN